MRFHTDWAQPWAVGLVRAVKDWLDNRCPLVTRGRFDSEITVRDCALYHKEAQVEGLSRALDALEADMRRLMRVSPTHLDARGYFSTDPMGISQVYTIEVVPLSRRVTVDGPYGELSPYAQHILKTNLKRDWAEAAADACDELFARIQRRAA